MNSELPSQREASYSEKLLTAVSLAKKYFSTFDRYAGIKEKSVRNIIDGINIDGTIHKFTILEREGLEPGSALKTTAAAIIAAAMIAEIKETQEWQEHRHWSSILGPKPDVVQEYEYRLEKFHDTIYRLAAIQHGQ